MLLIGLWLIWGIVPGFLLHKPDNNDTRRVEYDLRCCLCGNTMDSPFAKVKLVQLRWCRGENCSSGPNWNTDVCWTFRWRPEIELLIGQLAVMSSGNQMKKAPVKTTQPKEFSLTKPKPASLPVPELIPLQEKCKPVGLWAKKPVYLHQGDRRRPFKGGLFYRCQLAPISLQRRCRR